MKINIKNIQKLLWSVISESWKSIIMDKQNIYLRMDSMSLKFFQTGDSIEVTLIEYNTKILGIGNTYVPSSVNSFTYYLNTSEGKELKKLLETLIFIKNETTRSN